MLLGAGGIIDGKIEQSGLRAACFSIDAKERMPKHGSGVVQVGHCKNKRYRSRVHLDQPFVEPGAGVFLKAFSIKAQFLLQPVAPRNEFTLGMFAFSFRHSRCEKTCQRRFEFGLGIEFA